MSLILRSASAAARQRERTTTNSNNQLATPRAHHMTDRQMISLPLFRCEIFRTVCRFLALLRRILSC